MQVRFLDANRTGPGESTWNGFDVPDIFILCSFSVFHCFSKLHLELDPDSRRCSWEVKVLRHGKMGFVANSPVASGFCFMMVVPTLPLAQDGAKLSYKQSISLSPV